MKSLIGLFLLSLTATVRAGNELCFQNPDDINICLKSDRISGVTSNNYVQSLTLRLKSNVLIEPGAFHSPFTYLKLSFGEPASFGTKPFVLSLHQDSFSGLSDLTDLIIWNADLNITGEPLKHLKSLENFEWRTTQISELPVKHLATVPLLKKLSIIDNQITTLRDGDFTVMKNLTSLNLRRSKIVRLEPGCFRGLEKLRTLDLSSSRLRSLPDVFSDLKDLRKLDIEGSYIEVIAPNALRGMQSLTELVLANNHLKNLPAGTFDQLPALRVLDLSRHYWLKVTKGLFNNLRSLRKLYLQDLTMGSIEPQAFSGLNLTLLDLRACDVLEPGSLSGLFVKELKLSGWNYRQVPRAFNGLTARIVDLSRNAIEKIEIQDFAGLKSELLNLDSNRIREIAPGAFENTTVAKIILSNNPIEKVNKTLIGVPEWVEII